MGCLTGMGVRSRGVEANVIWLAVAAAPVPHPSSSCYYSG
jgi:hypothetical protein